MQPIPTLVAAAAGSIDGILARKFVPRPSSGPPWLLMYRGGLVAAGAALVALTEWEPHVATTLLTCGTYGLGSSLGSRVVKGSATLITTAGFTAHQPNVASGCSGCQAAALAIPHIG